jgi:hypothetical protein
MGRFYVNLMEEIPSSVSIAIVLLVVLLVLGLAVFGGYEIIVAAVHAGVK